MVEFHSTCHKLTVFPSIKHYINVAPFHGMMLRIFPLQTNESLLLTLLFDLMLSFCTSVASPIAFEPHSSVPIVAYVTIIESIGKK